MKNTELIEYQTVVLAALLHDIGKFLHRKTSETYSTSHHKTSALFICNEKIIQKMKNDKLYDINLLCFLVAFHHPVKNARQNIFFKEIEKRYQNNIHAFNLLKIVKRADQYSCKERDIKTQEKRKGEKRKAPLDSIYSRIDLGMANNEAHGAYRYHLTESAPNNCFPNEGIQQFSDDELTNQIEAFKDNLPDFSTLNKFSHVLISWMNYLEKYLTLVPSDTRYDHSDVSLYDHLRTSAAIAACLYKFHRHNLNRKTSFYMTKEFYFIGGDFSGIQNYIFEITNVGSGGAAKRLRARSAFVLMFCEATVHRILHELDLPLVCNLFSCGGKFLMIAPCTDEIEERLKAVKARIESEIHNTYFSRFTFLMHWRVIERYERDHRVYEFYKCANEMFDSLEQEKFNKASFVLKDRDGKWNENLFKADRLYKSYNEFGDCRICGKGPAVRPDSFSEPHEIIQCEICDRDKNAIGMKIPNCLGFAFGVEENGDKEKNSRITLFKGPPQYYAELIKNREDLKSENNYYLVYNFGEESNLAGNILSRHYTNHVPVDYKGNTLEFTEIAAFPKKANELSQGDEQGMLGILKADVDNLGLIFNKGFEKAAEWEKDIPPPDRKTISRFLTMSRMTDLFFSGWIQSAMEEENHSATVKKLKSIHGISGHELWNEYLNSGTIDFNKIYTVYSGGDDLVLIGPWETMIAFSVLLNSQFRKFTCNNPSITLSAGLTFVKPKFPVASGINQADTLLNKSKEEGKNRITLFNTTVEWEQLPKLIDFFLFLDDKLGDDNSNINKSFLYRLLEYHNMALSYLNKDEKKIEGLKFIAALNYDIGRNIIKRDKFNKIIKGSEELKKLNLLMDISENEKSLINNIKIPLFWTLYRNR